MRFSICTVNFVLFILLELTKSGPYQGDAWTSLPGAQKLNMLWASITENTSFQNFMSQQDFTNIFYNEDMTPTFLLEQEEMPYGRVKTVHQVGLMSRCIWQTTPAGMKYTGIFQGGTNCLARFNLAHNPDFDAFVPALSIKLLRDGFRSANLVLCGNMNGQSSTNFFEKTLSNHAEIPVHSQFADHFSTGVTNPFISSIGLQKWATHDQYGNAIPDQYAVFPFDTVFLPAQYLKDAYNPSQPWYNQIMSIYPGTVPYYVYARQEPGYPYENIAYIQVIDQPTFSWFGDNVYFVKHNDMSDDLRIRPDWAPYLQTYYVNNRKTDSVEGIKEEELNCPFH